MKMVVRAFIFPALTALTLGLISSGPPNAAAAEPVRDWNHLAATFLQKSIHQDSQILEEGFVVEGEVLPEDELPEGQADYPRLKFAPNDNGGKYSLRIKKDMLADPGAVAMQLCFLGRALDTRWIFESRVTEVDGPFMVAELLANAEKKSGFSQAWLATLYDRCRTQKFSEEFLSLLAESYKKTAKELTLAIAKGRKRSVDAGSAVKLVSNASVTYDSALQAWQNRPSPPGGGQKLEEFILNNDRKAVAAFLRAEIPWGLLEPAETSAWQAWVEAIAEPEASRAPFAYRGLGSAVKRMLRAEGTDGKPRYALAASAFTKGSPNFAEGFRKFWAGSVKQRDPRKLALKVLPTSPTISALTYGHSSNSDASPFISFSVDYQKASSFDKGGMGVVLAKVDGRRFFANFGGANAIEMEMLVPAIVFPDEVLAFVSGQSTDVEVKATELEESGPQFGTKDASYLRSGLKIFRLMTVSK